MPAMNVEKPTENVEQKKQTKPGPEDAEVAERLRADSTKKEYTPEPAPAPISRSSRDQILQNDQHNLADIAHTNASLLILEVDEIRRANTSTNQSALSIFSLNQSAETSNFMNRQQEQIGNARIVHANEGVVQHILFEAKISDQTVSTISS